MRFVSSNTLCEPNEFETIKIVIYAQHLEMRNHILIDKKNKNE